MHGYYDYEASSRMKKYDIFADNALFLFLSVCISVYLYV